MTFRVDSDVPKKQQRHVSDRPDVSELMRASAMPVTLYFLFFINKI